MRGAVLLLALLRCVNIVTSSTADLHLAHHHHAKKSLVDSLTWKSVLTADQHARALSHMGTMAGLRGMLQKLQRRESIVFSAIGGSITLAGENTTGFGGCWCSIPYYVLF